MEHKVKNGECFVVATPIGNLADMTYRAVDTLKQVDSIYCEDTRHSRKLCERYGITTPLKPYHEHNAEKQRPKIIDALERGERIALISDAGTPLISDPGYKLVHELRQSGYKVTPLPGACAAITALCAAGLPSDQFHFLGFLPPKQQARRQQLEQLRSQAATLIFYESPKRLQATLVDAVAIFGGETQATVARELTKQYESFYYGSLQQLAEQFAGPDAPKGEIVLLISPQPNEGKELSEAELTAMLKQLMQQMPLKQAAAEMAQMSGRSKRDCYQLALRLKEEG